MRTLRGVVACGGDEGHADDVPRRRAERLSVSGAERLAAAAAGAPEGTVHATVSRDHLDHARGFDVHAFRSEVDVVFGDVRAVSECDLAAGPVRALSGIPPGAELEHRDAGAAFAEEGAHAGEVGCGGAVGGAVVAQRGDHGPVALERAGYVLGEDEGAVVVRGAPRDADVALERRTREGSGSASARAASAPGSPPSPSRDDRVHGVSTVSARARPRGAPRGRARLSGRRPAPVRAAGRFFTRRAATATVGAPEGLLRGLEEHEHQRHAEELPHPIGAALDPRHRHGRGPRANHWARPSTKQADDPTFLFRRRAAAHAGSRPALVVFVSLRHLRVLLALPQSSTR